MRLLFEPKGGEQSLVVAGTGQKTGKNDVHAAMLGPHASGLDGVRAHLLGIVRGESAFQMDDAGGRSS